MAVDNDETSVRLPVYTPPVVVDVGPEPVPGPAFDQPFIDAVPMTVVEIQPDVTQDDTPLGDTPSDKPEGKPSAKAKSKKSKKSKKSSVRRRRVRNGILIGVLVLLLGVGATVGVAYAQLNAKVGRGSTGGMLNEDDRPKDEASISEKRSPGDPYAGKAVNILVVGSDQRGGMVNDGVGGARADTTFIAHVSADRTRVDAVSIPRDLWITIPNCVYEDGSRVPGSGASNQKFNAAFAFGGMGSKGSMTSAVACAMKAVEALSGVRLDGYVVVNFTGFAKIVNTIGGIDIYLPCEVFSRKAGNLSLPKGPNHLGGKAALAYARARTGKGLGDGSDLMRIARQQAVFEAVARKVLSMNYLTDIKTLYNFVGSVADAVFTDLGPSLADIAGFGMSLKNLSGDDFTFAMIPVGSAGDGGSVVMIPSRAEPIFKTLRKDTPLSAVVGKTSHVSNSNGGSGGSGGSGKSGAPPGMVAIPENQCR